MPGPRELAKKIGYQVPPNLNRQDYSTFHPTWEWGELNGEDRNLKGLDRLYAVHQFLRNNKSLNPASVISSDVKGYPDSAYPTELEFSDRKYSLKNNGSGWGEDWDKNEKGEWVHRSSGGSYWDDILDRLDKENPISYK